MSKMRVYKYASEHQTTSKDVIQKLKDLGVPVKSHMSVIEDQTIQKLNAASQKQASQTARKADESRKKRQKPSTGPSQQQSDRKEHASDKSRPSSDRTGSQADGKVRKRRARPSSVGVGSGRQRPVQNGASERGEERRPKKRWRKPTQNAAYSNATSGTQSRPNPSKKGSGPQQEQNQVRVEKRSDNGQRRSENGDHKNRFNRRQKYGTHNKKQRQNKQVQQKTTPTVQVPSKIMYKGSLTVAGLAEKLKRSSSEIIKKLMKLGVMATKNQELSKESIELIAADYGAEVEEEIPVDMTDFAQYEIEDKEESLIPRPPVVTMMGHVDHGKTTLLDFIRHTKVTSGEAGGITQHIGAYQVEEGDKKITFLDTPGHAAFTTMRARGAQVTDITVLVVAADDGVMPQTIEAVNHAKAADIPIIVAVNKIDVQGANPDRVKQELSEHGLIAEEWGGETIFVPLSALTGEGINELLEMILLVAEMGEYKANPVRLASGTVIEAELDKGRGPIATLLVQKGTLKVGDPVVIGHSFGRVRAMVNENGRRVEKADPSTPVEITGLNSVPEAGDPFLVFEDEKKARQVGEARASKSVENQRNETLKVSLDDLFSKIKEGKLKEINVIVKADVQGSVEALSDALEKIEVEGVKLNVIHTGAGAISESDIILASASNALIIGFNVRPDSNAQKTAKTEKVDVRLYRVIYDAINEMESAMKGMLDPEFEEKVIGEVEVRTTFKVSKIGTIAGSYVTDGKITRDSKVRLVRDGVVIFEGEIDSLKRFKEDAKEVATGYECGITLTGFNDIKEGDKIEAYIMAEKQRA